MFTRQEISIAALLLKPEGSRMGARTISFMFFFGLERLNIQMFMTSLFTDYISFILCPNFSLHHIFEGSKRSSLL
ncbi:MAG TPA: hypothetical protein DCE71_06670 [Parachlamydiales bacterium]|nr:hypothetical protein [Parachlamydiales bacterium]